MELLDIYSKSFFSDCISDTKYQMLHELGELIRDQRNRCSLMVNSNLLYYLGMSREIFQKEMLPYFKDVIGSNFVKQMCDDVYKSYENKFNAIQKKISFYTISELNIELYKRETQYNKIGDIKKITSTKVIGPLSATLTYLTRYGNETTVEYIDKCLLKPDLEKKQLKLYSEMKRCIEKFGFGRLMKLALQKRQYIIDKYSLHPITFTSCTFRGRSRIKGDIVSWNQNFDSKIKAFINISGLTRNSQITIPVKYSKKHHGKMKDYNNGTDTSYTIFFHEDRVRIILTKDDIRHYPSDKTNYGGIDVNIKHNMMVLSDGFTVDYDRKLLEQLSTELIKLDKLKENKDYKIGKQREIKINAIKNNIQHDIERKCVDLCKHCNVVGIDHIAMENLTSFGKSFNKVNDIKLSRLVKEVNICSIKNKVKQIRRKYDIAQSTVHPEMTSIECPVCHWVDKENRPSQEIFHCVKCQFHENADLVSSINIEQRLSSTVLRASLLKDSKIGDGTFIPDPFKKRSVLKTLSSLRYTP